MPSLMTQMEGSARLFCCPEQLFKSEPNYTSIKHYVFREVMFLQFDVWPEIGMSIPLKIKKK